MERHLISDADASPANPCAELISEIRKLQPDFDPWPEMQYRDGYEEAIGHVIAVLKGFKWNVT